MVTIRLTAFQPFASRRGKDTVVGMEFQYNPKLVNLLKTTLRGLRKPGDPGPAGGWLPDHGRWFCERQAWPALRQRLLDVGVTLTDEPPDDSPPEESTSTVMSDSAGKRFRLTIRSEPSDTPAIIRLRRVLKGLLRAWRFTCETVEQLQPEPAPVAEEKENHD